MTRTIKPLTIATIVVVVSGCIWVSVPLYVRQIHKRGFVVPEHHVRSHFLSHWIQQDLHPLSNARYRQDRVMLTHNYMPDQKCPWLGLADGLFDHWFVWTLPEFGYLRFDSSVVRFSPNESLTMIHNFVSEWECKEILETAKNLTWIKSEWSINPDSGHKSNRRRSMQTNETRIGFLSYAAHLNRLFNTGMRFECSGVIRYRTGDFLAPHSDSSHASSLLIYLNSLSSSEPGGKTCFTDFDHFCISPVQGTAVWWRSSQDHRMMHESTPLVHADSEKYIINCVSF